MALLPGEVGPKTSSSFATNRPQKFSVFFYERGLSAFVCFNEDPLVPFVKYQFRDHFNVKTKKGRITGPHDSIWLIAIYLI